MPRKRQKSDQRRDVDDLRPEYDFSKGVRGKHAKRYAQGTNVILLAPDVAKIFKTPMPLTRPSVTLSILP